MSTMSPPEATGLDERHDGRWDRLHEERWFRVEQLAALAAEPLSGLRHASVNESLRVGATTALDEIDAALARMDQGRYGLCIACSQPLPAHRLDILRWIPLCKPCHYNEQSCRRAMGRT